MICSKVPSVIFGILFNGRVRTSQKLSVAFLLYERVVNEYCERSGDIVLQCWRKNPKVGFALPRH